MHGEGAFSNSLNISFIQSAPPLLPAPPCPAWFPFLPAMVVRLVSMDTQVLKGSDLELLRVLVSKRSTRVVMVKIPGFPLPPPSTPLAMSALDNLSFFSSPTQAGGGQSLCLDITQWSEASTAQAT